MAHKASVNAVSLQSLTLSPPQELFHFMWRDGKTCCGNVGGAFAMWPVWSGHMQFWPAACPACQHIYRDGYAKHVAAQAAQAVAA